MKFEMLMVHLKELKSTFIIILHSLIWTMIRSNLSLYTQEKYLIDLLLLCFDISSKSRREKAAHGGVTELRNEC